MALPKPQPNSTWQVSGLSAIFSPVWNLERSIAKGDFRVRTGPPSPCGAYGSLQDIKPRASAKESAMRRASKGGTALPTWMYCDVRGPSKK